ncbi:MAG: cyclase family protein [Gemmatimonadota bacterium]|nr:cyclase family protein [Gemmatimonadota bacterium]
MKRIYDISIPIRDGGFVYPGNPEIRIAAQQSIANGAGANVSSLSFGSHTGTHVDAARHFFDAGQAVDEISLGVLTGPAVLIAFDEQVMSIGAADLEKHDIGSHTRVLLRTRNSALLGRRDFVRNYTYLAPDGAAWLASRGVKLVGVDYLSIEQFRSGHHRTHRTLLEQDIVIVEALDLSVPPPGEYELICLPLRLEGLDGAPARAILLATGD